MNQRNVAALVELIHEVSGSPPDPKWVLDFAQALSSRGVLVPAALTDEEAADIGSESDFTVSRCPENEAKDAQLVRATMERIAKGED